MEILRVLLVDDETLVRKSLKQLLPLAEFSMEVAGEASNGENALLWLKENQADIVFVDLSMPVMDGFELLQHINREYPDITKIVLTCHAELRMIQRAIAENISGYILKTDFDMEENRKLLERVRKNVLQNRSQKRHEVLLLYATDKECRNLQWQGVSIVHLSSHEAVAYTTLPTDALLAETERGAAVELTHEQTQRVRDDGSYLAEIVNRYLAYVITPQQRIYTLPQLPEATVQETDELCSQLLAGEWLLSSLEKNELIRRVEALRISVSCVMSVLAALYRSIDCIVPEGKLHALCLPAGACPVWSDVCQYMEQLSGMFQAHMREKQISIDRTRVLLRAIGLLRSPKVLFGKAEDVAMMVGFSRSHFSRCFSQFMGTSFRAYMQQMRLRYVQDKVEKEGMSIAEIAQMLGFINEEYFRKLYSIENNK